MEEESKLENKISFEVKLEAKKGDEKIHKLLIENQFCDILVRTILFVQDP